MVEFTKNGITYKNIRTQKVDDIPAKLGMDLDTIYSKVGADALIEFVNKWLKDTDVELVKKKVKKGSDK